MAEPPHEADPIVWTLLALLLGPAIAADAEGVPLDLVRRAPAGGAVAHQLPRNDGLYVRWDAGNAWGTDLLVSTIQDAARRMAWLLPDAEPLMVGDMSTRGGGPLYGHKTHDVGLDADLGLYLKGGRQPLDGFVDVRPRDLDLEANWLLVRSLLDSGHVQFVLLDQSHIDALRAYLLDEKGFPADYVDEIMPPPDAGLRWGVHGVVRHAPNHRSHLHVHVQRAADVL